MGTVSLPELKCWELLELVDIPKTQRHMGHKELDQLVRKLCSMHLLVQGRWHISTISNVLYPKGCCIKVSKHGYGVVTNMLSKVIGLQKSD